MIALKIKQDAEFCKLFHHAFVIKSLVLPKYFRKLKKRLDVLPNENKGEGSLAEPLKLKEPIIGSTKHL